MKIDVMQSKVGTLLLALSHTKKTSAGISGGQDGFQDEQTTKDRRGPSSVVFLPHGYPCQTGMAASS
jgi:hypothetical protein